MCRASSYKHNLTSFPLSATFALGNGVVTRLPVASLTPRVFVCLSPAHKARLTLQTIVDGL